MGFEDKTKRIKKTKTKKKKKKTYINTKRNKKANKENKIKLAFETKENRIVFCTPIYDRLKRDYPDV